MNKLELSVAMGCSLSTLTDLLARHGAAFPIINQGSNGRAFSFDPRAVAAHLRRCGDHRADILEAKLPRQLVYQPRASSADEFGKQAMAEWRIRDIQDALDADMGQIVLYCEMIAGIAEAGEIVDRDLTADLRRTLETAKVPAATVRAVASKITTARRTFTAEVEALFCSAFSAPATIEDPSAGRLPA